MSFNKDSEEFSLEGEDKLFLVVIHCAMIFLLIIDAPTPNLIRDAVVHFCLIIYKIFLFILQEN